jgi:hypothetical protein
MGCLPPKASTQAATITVLGGLEGQREGGVLISKKRSDEMWARPGFVPCTAFYTLLYLRNVSSHALGHLRTIAEHHVAVRVVHDQMLTVHKHAC